MSNLAQERFRKILRPLVCVTSVNFPDFFRHTICVIICVGISFVSTQVLEIVSHILGGEVYRGVRYVK